ncbi:MULTISPECIES: hypothetical protein [Vibrio]|uniref:Uncharacterized protein n=1 Tax=Vibrio algicola TaxID=2662262 RepID=A0A5Q0TDJ8_9VIBR|nr:MULTISPECIES: hypothetical protein [Vibrio]MBD1577009.1 hypothetical protein [Vibrio sp. S11_S32]
MNNLFNYVAAIKNDETHKIKKWECKSEELNEEDGVVTEIKEYDFFFHNGVVIKQSIEREIGEMDSDLVCQECFISYELISEPTSLDIRPKRKNFINICQESFWLKINKTHSLL